MRVFHGLLLLAFLLAVLIFAVQNVDPVGMHFLRWKTELPLAAVVVAAYILGMFSGWNVLGFLRRSLRRVHEPPRES